MKQKITVWGGIFALAAAVLLFAGGCRAERSTRSVSSFRAPAKVAFVKLQTEDNLRLSGRVFGDGPVGVVLGHMYPSDQNSWASFAKDLSKRGFTVLTFDFRGYGLSEGGKDIAKIDKDMRAATRWLAGRTNKVFLIGASMGGTAALKIARDQPNICGVAALSAPAEFMGLATGDIKGIGGPKLFIAASGDGSAADTARKFYETATEPKEIEIVPGNEHGTNLLRGPDNRTTYILLDWLKRYSPKP